MAKLVQLGLAPTLIIMFYIYIRDKYEKEPISLLLTGVMFGIIITVPIVNTENFITGFMPDGGLLMEAFYTSFLVASLVEEAFKYIVLYFLTWRNKNFNEKFDGIVYAVFISLGFAGVENILYVINPELGGVKTAIARAIFSVPGHALFGVSMGFYFALSKFEPHNRNKHMISAYIVPFLLHGIYDFILLSSIKYMMTIFIIFVVYLWVTGFKRMKKHIQSSPFKSDIV